MAAAGVDEWSVEFVRFQYEHEETKTTKSSLPTSEFVGSGELYEHERTRITISILKTNMFILCNCLYEYEQTKTTMCTLQTNMFHQSDRICEQEQTRTEYMFFHPLRQKVYDDHLKNKNCFSN